MAKLAYLVLAHENPRHLERLIRALTTDQSRVFVHLDQKSNAERFGFLTDMPAVETLADRVKVYWSDFSMVEATLRLMRQALAHPAGFERFVLLSGVDYPIRSSSYIERFFAANPSSEFIDMTPMPNNELGKRLWRLTWYKARSGEPIARNIGRRILFRLGLRPRHRDYRPVFGELQPFAGDQWWGLTRDACEHVLAFVEQRPEVVEYFRNTPFPDEMFFQTVLANSPFRERVRRSVTFVEWDRPGAAHPSVLDATHVERFRASPQFRVADSYGDEEMLFARKFAEPSDELVALVDAVVAEKDSASTASSTARAD
jgi:hypothetical protein